MEISDEQKISEIINEIIIELIDFTEAQINLNRCGLNNIDILFIKANIAIDFFSFIVANNSLKTNYSPSEFYIKADYNGIILNTLKKYEKQQKISKKNRESKYEL